MLRTLTIASFVLILASASSAQNTMRAATDDEIIRALLPNGNWAEERNLKQFKRVDEIHALRKAQLEAKDWRAVSIAYLLAVLNYKYSANRRVIVDKHNSCRQGPYPHTLDCWDQVSGFLMGLFRRGDHPLLRRLLAMGGLPTDGAFSESLGSFYADTLRAQPRLFVKTLMGFPLKIQRADAMLAGYVDGGGMEPKMFRDVRRSLRNISLNPRDPLAPVAQVCLIEINKAHSQTH
jgi:hypothetical protein